MTFLVIVLVVFFLLYMTSGSSSKVQENPCKTGHKWAYKKQPDNEEIEYLQCERCSQFPGYEGRD